MIDHNFYMSLAIEEAKKAWGKTSPNPLVGAIIVKDEEIIGKGYHKEAGKPHAEIEAIRDCHVDIKGASCYVTLEPCSTFGRTPPCTEALIKEGIAHVIIGSIDKNPNHQGTAIEILQKNNVQVTTNILESECEELNKPFFHWIQTNKPLVTLKLAMTLDGKIATKSGQSKWITGAEARNYVQILRKRCDAIMVGGETAILDDPSLDIREDSWIQPTKIIWTSKELPNSLKITNDTSLRKNKPKNKEEWEKFLRNLGEANCLNLLIEGGGELAANALQFGIVDEVYFFIAPKILGGRDSRPVVGGENPASLEQAYNLSNTKTQLVGKDILVRGDIKN